MDYRALATTPVAMAELRRGKLAMEKTMRAHRGSAAAANLMMVKWRGQRSDGRSCLAGGTETRARELAETTAATRRRRRTPEGESREWNDAVHATGSAVASCRTRWGLMSGTNGDVRTPGVQTRGVTGELPCLTATSFNSQTRLKPDFCPVIIS